MMKVFLAEPKSKKLLPEGVKIILAGSLDKAKQILKEQTKKDLAKYSKDIRKKVHWKLEEKPFKEGILYDAGFYFESWTP